MSKGMYMAELEREERIRAAAPDLLEALEAALPLCEGFDDSDNTDDGEQPIVAPIIAQIKAAIAKAKGEA